MRKKDFSAIKTSKSSFVRYEGLKQVIQDEISNLEKFTGGTMTEKERIATIKNVHQQMKERNEEFMK